VRVVSEGINTLRSVELGVLLVTHYQRILTYVKPDYVHVMLDGEVPGGIQSVGLHFMRGHPYQPRHLSRMRRDDRRPLPRVDHIEMADQSVQSVRVHHDGPVEFWQERLDQFLCGEMLAESRTDGESRRQHGKNGSADLP
jgi:ABC-type microcin C transport system duplicated ATPase subunit YejF